MKLLEYPGLFLLLVGWGIVVGAAAAAAAWYRVSLNLHLPRMIEQAPSPWQRLFFRPGYEVYIVVCFALLGAAYVYVPYLFLKVTFACTKCPLGREALWTVGVSSLAPLLPYFPRSRRRRRRYLTAHTATCSNCGRINDRPLFPKHHKYFAVCGFAAKIVDAGYACRWCDTPLHFRES